MNRIRVLLADDHAVVRAGLAILLSGQSDIEVTAQVGSTDELLQKAVEIRPDVILLDLSMPTAGGLAAVQELKEHGVPSRCLVLTMHDEPAMMRSARAAGVCGYLVKSTNFAEVGTAIRVVHSGQPYFSAALNQDLEPAPLPTPAPDAGAARRLQPPLSPLERDMLRLLSLGHSAHSIAEHLAIDEPAVEAYRLRLCERLGLTARLDLVRYAIEAGLLDPSCRAGASTISLESTAFQPFEEAAFSRDLRTVFQPILEVAELPRLFALECLSRGPIGTPLEAADRLFDWIRAARNEVLADRICISKALFGACLLPGQPDVSVNVHARTIAQPDFPSDLAEITGQLDLSSARLILEIVEHGGVLEHPTLLRNLDRVRAEGVRIAIDDFGLGQSNFQRLLECHPDFVKIERYFVADGIFDHRKLAVIESLSNLSRRLGTRMIIEGIETPTQLEMVLSHGIELVQGYLFSPPVSRQQLLSSTPGWLSQKGVF